MNNDNEIAGDAGQVPHLMPPAPAHPSAVADFVALARRTARDRARWEPLVRYDPVSRWYHRLDAGPGHEVWLLGWLPGQGSGRHAHGASSGVWTVLRGALTERTGPAGTGGRLTVPGALHLIAPGSPHEVSNDTLEPAVSLHVYFPGLTEMPMLPADPARTETSPTHHPPVGRAFGPAGGAPIPTGPGTC
ncbi:cysteine dioxygenase family protein [Streptomyces sp. ST2-7A]|uniref:cysteine dioxygenase n=1 Tax=Streptomyces sp. ST2-7A TaxID=2907214 RepID=UPI001F1E13A0|nr:cysteine dioxygenase family protein [Streptomyces sp. ST2-7A]MCE7083281.1 cysteine dioxygenase family protein [Streptomyces sp. ST2-7A]